MTDLLADQALKIIDDLHECASSWEPKTCLVGSVRAGDIVSVMSYCREAVARIGSLPTVEGRHVLPGDVVYHRACIDGRGGLEPAHVVCEQANDNKQEWYAEGNLLVNAMYIFRLDECRLTPEAARSVVIEEEKEQHDD